MRPRSSAAWTMAVFGALALVMGVVGLVAPNVLLALLGFETPEQRASSDYTLVFLSASSMASFNMGVYYLVAVATEWRAFYRATAIFRLVTFAVFTALVFTGHAPTRFLGVAIWEGLGAVATALALRVDHRVTRQ